MLDLVLRNGLVIDGTGAPRKRAAVGVRAGRVVSVGEIGEPARRVIDVDGAAVAPGFIDIHTHLDGQVFWDPLVTPSTDHGFTTVIGGNCGFTFAPMTQRQSAYAARLMAVVEGIPLEVLEASVPFDWSDFGGFLSRLEGRVGVNVGFLVGHSTLRRLVMDKDANDREATDAEIEAMCALLRGSLAGGGMGFSSSWTTVHMDDEAKPAPSRLATHEELYRLAAIVGDFPGTTLEFAPGMQFGARETEAMIGMSLAANRPVNWNVLQVRTNDRRLIARKLAPCDMAAARGARIVALTFPDSTLSWHSMQSGMLYDNLPGWADVMHQPLPRRIELLADRSVRARLAEGAALADSPFLKLLAAWDDQKIFSTVDPALNRYVGRTLGEVGRERGCSALDAFLDITVADNLQTYVELPCADDTDELWEMRAALWRDPRTLLGGSDAGAHLDTLASQRYPTALLAKAVRERGLVTLEEAVHMLADEPARFYGLRGRGRIVEGWHADIVVFDPDSVGHRPVGLRHDLPTGASRLYVEADGIHHVLVNGRSILEGGQPTGELPGTVLRSGDLDTNDLAVATSTGGVPG
jgi:N-acyl-D-aspartate/D-glutamate deacylase